MKRRIDVNLDELDQIIDRGTRAPLSESEGQKLKTALHAMAETGAKTEYAEKTSRSAGCNRQTGGFGRIGSGRSWAQGGRGVYRC